MSSSVCNVCKRKKEGEKKKERDVFERKWESNICKGNDRIVSKSYKLTSQKKSPSLYYYYADYVLPHCKTRKLASFLQKPGNCLNRNIPIGYRNENQKPFNFLEFSQGELSLTLTVIQNNIILFIKSKLFLKLALSATLVENTLRNNFDWTRLIFF